MAEKAFVVVTQVSEHCLYLTNRPMGITAEEGMRLVRMTPYAYAKYWMPQGSDTRGCDIIAQLRKSAEDPG